MLRPTAAKAVATAATALVLLTACGGNNDKGSFSEGGDTTASTPSTPGVASFDPPKAFVTSSAFGVERTKKDNQRTFKAGMVGQTTLIAGLEGISGRNIAAQGQAWFYPATELDTTEVLDLSRASAAPPGRSSTGSRPARPAGPQAPSSSPGPGCCRSCSRRAMSAHAAYQPSRHA